MNPLIFLFAGLGALGATLVTYRDTQHRDVDRPFKWCGIVGFTSFLSPLLIDELYVFLWLLYKEFFNPIYYHTAVLLMGFAIGGIVFLQYQLTMMANKG